MCDADKQIPVGMDFFNLVWEQENLCQEATDKRLPNLGAKANASLERLGTALSFLDRVASCWWNCPGGGYKEHTMQYVAGRVCNSARGAVRLMRFGFYDEALNLVRSMGEIANLLVLFKLEPSTFGDWRDSDHKTRLNEFGPSKIRKRVISLGSPLPMDEKKYGLLCELATHPVPDMRPQSYNRHGQVISGGIFQEGAVLMLINEISAMVAVALSLTATFVGVPAEPLKQIRKVARDLAEALGALSVTNYSEAIKGVEP